MIYVYIYILIKSIKIKLFIPKSKFLYLQVVNNPRGISNFICLVLEKWEKTPVFILV